MTPSCSGCWGAGKVINLWVNKDNFPALFDYLKGGLVMGRRFHIGYVLSITTGRMVSNRGMGSIYDILDYMTGESLYTHQLPGAMTICRPVLLERFPQLEGVDASGVNEGNIEEWLAAQIAKYGEWFEVEPLRGGVYDKKDPVEELVDMVVVIKPES